MAYNSTKYSSKDSPMQWKKLTREEAYEIAIDNGIDFSKSYYGAFLSKGYNTAYAREHLIDDLAKKTGFAKPKDISRSVAFFNHLKKRFYQKN